MERKEAIEIIKKNWPDSSFTMLREALETLIPELAESEDKRIRKWLIHYFKEVCDNVSEKEKKGIVAWLEKRPKDSPVLSNSSNTGKVEQKPAWSEKDEEMRLTVLQDLQNIKDSYPNVNVEPEFNWLKSLKGRVQLQQKQEWSEEDEKMWLQIINEIEAIKSNSSTVFEKNIAQDKIDWLKSIRPQKQWIPSKEQIIALRWILNNVSSYNMYKEEINGLLEQLQKLREEWL